MEDWTRRQLIERQLPRRLSPVMYQRWLHLLFLHWPLATDIIQRTLPQGLQADTYVTRPGDPGSGFIHWTQTKLWLSA
jgi:uncharacterized protein YqjF (DUF2071 family)